MKIVTWLLYFRDTMSACQNGDIDVMSRDRISAYQSDDMVIIPRYMMSTCTNSDIVIVFNGYDVCMSMQ